MTPSERDKIAKFKRCINCKHKGKQVGLTNNLGKELGGKLPIYRCSKHPSVEFYASGLACSDYE